MEPESIHRSFEAAFNAGDLDALLALYEPDAVLIVEPGVVIDTMEGISGALQWFLGFNGQITLDTKLAAQAGDLAYLANRWTLTGTDPEGKPFEMGSLTSEVAKQQPDGSWRYIIDNAIGDGAVAEG
jgi:ketosteroid isomerase-like protein